MNRIIDPDSVPAALDEQTQSVSIETIRAVVRDAKLTVDRNWWFVATVVISILAILLLINNMRLRSELTYEYDVAWVKMYQDGAWDIDFNDSERGRETLPSTIDSLLHAWVEARYSKEKHDIRFDYGFANLFMAQKLSNHFTSAEGFNAPQVAADLVMCAGCPEIVYKVGAIDHFDSDRSTFGTEKGTLYQTNVFATRSVKYTSEQDTTNTDSERIIRIKWRLMTEREVKHRVNLKGGKDWLRKNPVGLEIIEYDELEDGTH